MMTLVKLLPQCSTTPAHHTVVFPFHTNCLCIVICLKKGCGSFQNFATEASEAIEPQHLSCCFQVK